MDAAPITKRYPAYTLAQLEKIIANGNPANREGIEAEIAARKAGTSVTYKVPQIVPGKGK